MSTNGTPREHPFNIDVPAAVRVAAWTAFTQTWDDTDRAPDHAEVERTARLVDEAMARVRAHDRNRPAA